MENTTRSLILNVDDYAPALYARTRTLRGAGFDVREATNGRQALDMVRALRPDVVILDVNLPDMSGIAVCRQIKQDPETAGVIVLQTSATAVAASDRTRALEGGADSYMVQPAEAEELIANVRALIRLKRAETALGESRRIWKAALAATNDAVFLVDENLVIRAANEKAVRMYGYSLSEFEGMPLRQLRPASAAQGLDQQLQEARERDGLVYETEHQRKDGSVFPVEVSSKPLGDLPSVQYVHATRDITERRRTEQNVRFLSEASKVLASSLDISATLSSIARLAVPHVADWCAVDLVNDDGKVEQVEVAHVNREKVKWARELRERFPVDETAPVGLAKVIRTGEPEFYPTITDELLQATARSPEELVLARQVGFSAAMIVPLKSHAGTLGAITLVSAESGHHFLESDLETALELGRRAANAIENARLYEAAQSAIRTRDIFVSVASHELKTPVTVIQGYAELLKRLIDQAPSGENQDGKPELHLDQRIVTERVSRIHNASQRLTRLLNDLLDVNRIQRGALELQLEEVELLKLLSETLQVTLQRERGISNEAGRVRIELTSGCKEVWGNWDPGRIEQVLINLLDNAVKYSPRDSTVQVAVALEEPDGREGLEAHVTVRDEGIGIPAEDQARLFQPFMRAGNANRLNLPGTGLGLAIAREIVERHGGRIWVESDWPIVGTTFHVVLPATRAS